MNSPTPVQDGELTDLFGCFKVSSCKSKAPAGEQSVAIPPERLLLQLFPALSRGGGSEMLGDSFSLQSCLSPNFYTLESLVSFSKLLEKHLCLKGSGEQTPNLPSVSFIITHWDTEQYQLLTASQIFPEDRK